MVQCGKKIDALDHPVFGMVIVPADDIVLVGVRLFCDTVVKDQHTIIALDCTNVWLDPLPQVCRRTNRASEKPPDAIVADLSVKER